MVVTPRTLINDFNSQSIIGIWLLFWLCSFFIVTFSLCMYLSIVNFSGHEIKIVVVVVVVVVVANNEYSCLVKVILKT